MNVEAIALKKEVEKLQKALEDGTRANQKLAEDNEELRKGNTSSIKVIDDLIEENEKLKKEHPVSQNVIGFKKDITAFKGIIYQSCCC